MRDITYEDGKKVKQSEYSASLTVEASIIVPMITVIIFLILYFTFYLHDRVKFESRVHTLSLNASNLVQYSISQEGSIKDNDRSILYFFIDGKSKEKRYLKEQFMLSFDTGLFIGEIEDLSVESNLTNISYRGNISYNIPLLNFFGLFSADSFKIPFHIKAAIFPREETTRIIEVALKTGESIKGVSDAIDKVVEVLNGIR